MRRYEGRMNSGGDGGESWSDILEEKLGLVAQESGGLTEVILVRVGGSSSGWRRCERAPKRTVAEWEPAPAATEAYDDDDVRG